MSVVAKAKPRRQTRPKQSGKLSGAQMKEIYKIMQQVNKVMKRQNKALDQIIAKHNL